MKLLYRLIVAVGLLFVTQGVFAQCNEYTKRECIPLLAPYTFNGQLNNAVLSQGETAELQLTFYKGQEYRILVKGEDLLSRLHFELFDADYNKLYDNADDKYAQQWDFEVQNTDDFIIRVTVPEAKLDTTPESGCVSILVGFKAFGSRTIFK